MNQQRHDVRFQTIDNGVNFCIADNTSFVVIALNPAVNYTDVMLGNIDAEKSLILIESCRDFLRERAFVEATLDNVLENSTDTEPVHA